MGILDQALAWLNGPKVQPSGIDRRRFLQFLGGTAAGVAIAPLIDVERLLWTPKPMILAPTIEELAFITPNWITMEALRILENNLTTARMFAPDWKTTDHLIGHTVSVNHAPVTLTDQYQVSCDMPHGKVNRSAFVEHTIRPAVNALTARLPERVVFGELPLPTGPVSSSRASSQRTGAALRTIQGAYFDPVDGEFKETLRIDVLTGKI
jgi:hypothetical protein